MYTYVYRHIHIYVRSPAVPRSAAGGANRVNPQYMYMCKGSQQGGTTEGTISAATLNRFLALGSVVVGAH